MPEDDNEPDIYMLSDLDPQQSGLMSLFMDALLSSQIGVGQFIDKGGNACALLCVLVPDADETARAMPIARLLDITNAAGDYTPVSEHMRYARSKPGEMMLLSPGDASKDEPAVTLKDVKQH